jgi:hypothetical protein
MYKKNIQVPIYFLLKKSSAITGRAFLLFALRCSPFGMCEQRTGNYANTIYLQQPS